MATLALIDDPSIPEYRRIYDEELADAFGCTAEHLTALVKQGALPPAFGREQKRRVWLVGQVRSWLMLRAKEANEKAIKQNAQGGYTKEDFENDLQAGRL